MKLEDLMVEHFSVERIGNKMVAHHDPNGNYRAKSAEMVEQALTDGSNTDIVDVRIGGKWHEIKPSKR